MSMVTKFLLINFKSMLECHCLKTMFIMSSISTFCDNIFIFIFNFYKQRHFGGKFTST